MNDIDAKRMEQAFLSAEVVIGVSLCSAGLGFRVVKGESTLRRVADTSRATLRKVFFLPIEDTPCVEIRGGRDGAEYEPMDDIVLSPEDRRAIACDSLREQMRAGRAST